MKRKAGNCHLTALLRIGCIFGSTVVAARIYASSSAAETEPSLDDVIVTANRQGEQSLQSVPMDITVLDPSRWGPTSNQTLSDILRGVPGISVVELGGGQNNIIIRGVNSQGVPDPSDVEVQPLVAVYLDDTPISVAGATPAIQIGDLERIEILRGPQGTLYGAGAMAGTLRYITQKPNPTAVQGSVDSSVGATEGGAASYSIRGMANLPLVNDALALRLNAYDGRDGGYIDNRGTGVTDANWQNNLQVRTALRWDNGGPLTADASYFYLDVQAGGHNDAYSQLAPNQFDSNTRETYLDKLGVANLAITYDSPQAVFASSTSYLGRRIRNLAGFQYGDEYYFGLPEATRSTVVIDNRLDDIAQEFRISSHPNWYGHWIAGLFLEEQHRTESIDIPTPGLDAAFGINSLNFGAAQPNDQYTGLQAPTTRQAALYGEFTFSRLDPLELTVGLRGFHWHQSFNLYAGGLTGALGPHDPEIGSGDGTENGVNPRINLAHHISDQVMVFAEASRGFRYGGVNQPIPAALCAGSLAEQRLSKPPATYGPDQLWTYSVGEKSELEGERLVLNATGFLTRWSNVQSRHDLTCGYYFEQTSGQIRSTGVDLDSQFQVTRSLRLGVSASFTDAKTSEPIPNLDAAEGAQVPYSPREILRASAGYRRQLPIGILSLQADYDYRSAEGTEFDAGSTLFRKIPATRVANVAGTWTAGTTAMTLYVRNLTNTQIITGINPNGYLRFQPGDTVYLGRPRSVGLRLQISL